MSVITKDLGVATAYGYAKSKGYTGTEEEFAELMASYADVAQQAEAAAQDAEDAKDEAVTAKTDAQTAKTAAQAAQSAAETASGTASTKASEAAQSAQTASGSATAAQTSATAAAGSAQMAQTVAQTATTKASEASSSASAASTAKTGAETARTGAQTAQAAAETAQANAEAAASSVSASAAQIDQNTADIGQIKNDLSEYSVIEKTSDAWELGGMDTLYGTYLALSTRIRLTEYIDASTVQKVVAKNGITVSLLAYGMDGTYIGWYKGNGVFDKALSGWYYVDEFDLTDYPLYKFRFVARNEAAPSSDVSVSIAENIYFVSGIRSLDEKTDDIYKKANVGSNLINNKLYTPHAYVDNSGTVKTTSNPSSTAYPLCLSDFIRVIPGKPIYISAQFLAGQYYAFYTEDLAFVGGKNEYGVWYTHLGICSKTVPATAAYLRVTCATEANAQTIWATYSGGYPVGYDTNASVKEYVDYHYYPDNPCDYNGREITVFNKIICIGDSITSGYFNTSGGGQSINKYSYPSQLAKLTGVEVANKGDAGETSVSWWESHSSEDFSGYDCAIINLGINDELQNVAEADTRSAFASIIGALKSANTGIKIFIANVVPAFSRGNATYDAINAIIEDIADNTQDCYFIDMTEYGHTVGVANVDGHLTACGYLRLAQDYISAIGWIIKANPVAFRYVQFIGTNLQPGV